MLAGGTFLIVRRIRQNRRDAALRAEGRSAEGEEVSMRLLDQDGSHVIFDEDDEDSEQEEHEDQSPPTSRGQPASLGTNSAAFQSGFLHDSDREEDENTPLAVQRPA